MSRTYDILKHEQYRTFTSHPSKEWCAAVQALKEVEAQGDEASRVYAAATHVNTLDAWQRREGVTPATGHACLGRLIGRKCDQYSYYRARREVPCALPGADHITLWLKDGIPEVYVTQPYYLHEDTMGAIAALCERWGLRCTVSTWPAWHFPSGVLSILVRRKPETPAPTRRRGVRTWPRSWRRSTSWTSTRPMRSRDDCCVNLMAPAGRKRSRLTTCRTCAPCARTRWCVSRWLMQRRTPRSSRWGGNDRSGSAVRFRRGEGVCRRMSKPPAVSTR
jgi:hypothetical protein